MSTTEDARLARDERSAEAVLSRGGAVYRELLAAHRKAWSSDITIAAVRALSPRELAAVSVHSSLFDAGVLDQFLRDEVARREEAAAL